MKKTAIILTALLVLGLSGFVAAADGALVTVREERFDDETVSFVRRHPRIYGNYNPDAIERMNLILFEEGNRAYLSVRYAAAANDEKATGETIVIKTCDIADLLCFRFETAARGDSGTAYGGTRCICLDRSSGKRLYFRDLFVKDGAVREAVTEVFQQQALRRGGPDTEWELDRIKSISSMPFYIDQGQGVLAVMLCDSSGKTVEITVEIELLSQWMNPSYVFEIPD